MFMKQLHSTKLAILVLILLGCSGAGNAQTYFTSPGTYTYTVPSGVTSITVDMSAGRGGNNYSAGGYGGRVVCTLSVTPTQVLYVNVGAAGGDGGYYSAGSGGFNGGGNCTYRFGGGGGGASDIMQSPYTVNDRLVVAGGGGGAGYDCGGGDWGGNGGDLNGQSGAMCYSYYNGGFTGYGGNQYSGGSGGYYGGSGGYQGTGGDGSGYGGGGGGGYYGGGGGYYGGGGGGSSYTDAVLASNVSHYQGYNGSDGSVTITENCTAGNISGSSAVCTGYTTTLTADVPGGTWTSDDNTIASIDPVTGDVTGVAAGATTITYTNALACGTVFSTFSFSVADAPTYISGSATICQNQTTTYTSSGGGAWSSNDNTIASIDPGSGIATGINPGATTLTYQIGTSCYVTQNVTVLGTDVITGTAVACVGLTTPLAESYTGGTWTTSNTALATIDPSTGVATGVSAGFPNIIYTQPNSCVITTPFTVHPLPAAFTGPTSVCQTSSITLGETSTGGTWSSSNTTQATVNKVTSTTASVSGVSGTSSPTITYTLPTGCLLTTAITVNTLPVPITAPALGSCITNPINPIVTLVDGTGTGSWSSSNPLIATIVSYSGDVTGLTAGTTTISYTLPTGCYATLPYTINPLPEPIGGPNTVCGNATIYLTDFSFGGTWSSSNSSFASIGSGTGIVTGVSGFSTPTISYTLHTGCLTITTITVNPAPAAVSGNTSVCVGSSSPLFISGGGTWASSSPGLASITPGPIGGGVVTGLIPGNPVMTYTLPTTGCSSTTTVTVNPVPATITGPTGICFGATTTLNDATLFGAWSSNTTTVATVSGSGLVSAVTPGTATITYALPATGCNVTQTVSVNPLPIPFNLVIPGGVADYCSGGTGIDIQLVNSESAVSYQLYINSVIDGTPFGGTNSVLDFGSQTAAGSYTVVGTNTATGCANNMPGSPNIVVDALPIIYNLSFTGSSSNFCAGTAGTDLVLSGSQSGYAYTLYIDGVPGPLTVGTGSPIDFGPQSVTGTYTVLANAPGTFCPNWMTGSVTVGINPLPGLHNVTVTNSGNYCAGTQGVRVGLDYANTSIDYQLWSSAGFIKTLPGANSPLDFGTDTADTYIVVGVNSVSGCSDTMTGNAIVNKEPLPVPYPLNVIGSSSFCSGTSGVHIKTGNSDNGINYQLFEGTVPVGLPLHGSTGIALDFGYVTSNGTYIIVATDNTTRCADTLTGNAVVATYPALTVYNLTVSGGGAYCAGGAGLHLLLSGSQLGIRYDLINSSTIVGTKIGTGTSLDFGLDTATGAYSVVATNTTTTCTANMNGNPTITINSLPVTYAVTETNGGNFCAGSTGVHIGLGFSDIGVSYQLYKAHTTTVGTPKAGNTAALDYGAFTTTGTYTIIGTNNTTHCSSNMTDSAVVVMNPVPVAYTTTGGGSYCSGGTGVPVGLSGSDNRISYQLYNGPNPVSGGTAKGTTGSAISFGSLTPLGIYTVQATDSVSGCTNTMKGSVVITINPLPTANTVTGGGAICAGSTGVPVGLNTSTAGINYTLSNGTKTIATLPGVAGKSLNYGLQTVAGTYTVAATNVITGCIADMSNSVAVIVNPLPAVDTVKGGGSYCAGGIGADITLSNADAGISYQLYKGSVAIGSGVTGMNAPLDLGFQTSGIYTVLATDMGSGCTKIMTGSATATATPVPNVYTVTGSGTICAGAAGIHINLSGSESGVGYQLYNGSTAIGTPITGTGVAMDFGAFGAKGTYTVTAANITTSCADNMAGSGTINVNSLPVVQSVMGGGHYCFGSTGVNVSLAGTETDVNYQLYNNGISVGTPFGGTGIALNFGPQTLPGLYSVIAASTTTSCTNNMMDSVFVTVDPTVTPAVTITATNNICTGAIATFTVTPVNGGLTPTFSWSVGGLTTAYGSTFSYLPANNDLVTATMTGSATCATTPGASGSVRMTVLPFETPGATVVTDPGNYVCHGIPVTFTATPSIGGMAPVYTWLNNSVPVGKGTTYTYIPTTANNGDVITFRLISNYQCRTIDTFFSIPVIMRVDSLIMPVVTVSSKIGPVVGVGQVDTFFAKINNDPNTPYAYQWYLDGNPLDGATSSLYIDRNVFNGDSASCVVTRLGACGGGGAVGYTKALLTNLSTKQVNTGAADVTVLPNPNRGEFVVKGTLGTDMDEEAILEITNMLGQVVYTNKVMAHSGNINERIKLSNTLANGMYILSLHSDVANNVFHIVVEQ